VTCEYCSADSAQFALHDSVYRCLAPCAIYEYGLLPGYFPVTVGKPQMHAPNVQIPLTRSAPFANCLDFCIQIATMKAVNHPSCVLLHEVYDETNKTYMVLDLITGGTVMDRIIAMDHFSEKDAAAVTADVLAAVQYLHSIGITHRDIKPENLLYASNDPNSPDYNTIKVADFGLAKFTSEQSQMKTTCGTPGYVAPEVSYRMHESPPALCVDACWL
jgi:serine/threonine protein kinase